MAFVKIKRHGRVLIDVPAVLKYYERIELIDQLYFSGTGNAQARCPAAKHDDSDPSWGISIRTGVHNCFGCGWCGGVISFIMELESIRTEKTITYDRAVEKGLQISSSEQVDDYVNKVVKSQRALNEREFKYYPESILTSLAEKFDYLSQRGINSSTCIDWDIRYSEQDERYVLPVRNFKKSIAGFIGIADSTKREQGWDKVLYSPGLLISRLLYGVHRYDICPKDTVILVEGAIDCLKVASVVENKVAVMAILHSSLTNHQAQILKDIGYKKVIALMDNDDPDDPKYKGHGAPSDHLWESIEERLGDSMKLYRPIYEASDPGEMSNSQIIKVLNDYKS